MDVRSVVIKNINNRYVLSYSQKECSMGISAAAFPLKLNRLNFFSGDEIEVVQFFFLPFIQSSRLLWS